MSSDKSSWKIEPTGLFQVEKLGHLTRLNLMQLKVSESALTRHDDS